MAPRVDGAGPWLESGMPVSVIGVGQITPSNLVCIHPAGAAGARAPKLGQPSKLCDPIQKPRSLPCPGY